MHTKNSDSAAIRILLVDDQELFLAGLRMLLESESDLLVIGEARNRSEALDGARRHPDIVLLDLELGTENGLDFLPGLLAAGAGARVIVLTDVSDPQVSLRAVSLGATGVVHKVQRPDILLKAIRKVHIGEAWLNRSMIVPAMMMSKSLRLSNGDPEAAKISQLTVREIAVIAKIGQGLRNKEIGRQLSISEKTVRHYLTSIFEKLDVSDRFALMIYAYQHGLAKVPASRSIFTTVA